MISTATAPVGQDARVTITGGEMVRHVIDSIYWSYSTTPTTGRLLVADAGVTVFDLDVPLAGTNTVSFLRGLQSTILKNDMTVTLTGGGVGAIGKLSVEWHDEPA